MRRIFALGKTHPCTCGNALDDEIPEDASHAIEYQMKNCFPYSACVRKNINAEKKCNPARK